MVPSPHRSACLAWALVTLLGAGGSLLAAAPFLEWLLVWDLALGTVLAACLLLSLASLPFLLSPPASNRRRFALGGIALAAGWLPLSVLLAGNGALHFSGHRFLPWLLLTALTGAVPVLLLAGIAVVTLWSRHRGRPPSPTGETS